MNPKVLVAGVGNIFLGDDGFGPEVANAIARRQPGGVVVRDFGARTFDLEVALEAAEIAVVIDVVARDGAPGTLYVIDPADPEAVAGAPPGHATTSTEIVLRAAARSKRGETPRALRVVGCVPETFGAEDVGALGLSPAVANSVESAADLVLEVARALGEETLCTSSR
jgi:hydrogenase maturation protease